MVLLEAIGLAGTEVFNYNRENYEYDQEQRIKRDVQSIGLQIARFELFRQDIEDLVKLTVDKMDMYHLVGALFLAFTVTMFTEGRLHETNVPAFFLGVHFLATAGAFVYLLLAVWLSMHASICSHSFGVRLRTRYVRLPIPSLAQLQGLASKLADFEKTGIKNVMRLPFGGKAQDWTGNASGAASSSGPAPMGTARDAGSVKAPGGQALRTEELLGQGEQGFRQDEDVLNDSTGTSQTGTHVQLFRKLQAKWQCYDAYARVCMSLGVHQITLSLSYYLIGSCLILRDSLSTAIALVFVLQIASVSLLVLDISGLRKLQLFCLQTVYSLPPVIVLVALALGSRDETWALDKSNRYPIVCAASFVQALCFEVIIWVAKPTNDEASLPRRFRSVLFLDVFGERSDPTDAEIDGASRNNSHESRAAIAEGALSVAWMALRRWKAIPRNLLSTEQNKAIAKLESEFMLHRRMLLSSLNTHNASHNRPPDTTVETMVETRTWQEMSQAERSQDHYAGFLMGPLTTGHVYDLEKGQRLDQKEGQAILSLDDVSAQLTSAVAAVRVVVAGQDDEDEEKSKSDHLVGREKLHIGSRKLGAIDRLPWKTMRRMTRVLQMCWLILGVLQLLHVLDVLSIDHDIIEGEERRLRRLAAAPALSPSVRPFPEDVASLHVEQVDVVWPYGSFFQLLGMTYLPEPVGLLVRSRSAQYKAPLDGSNVGAAEQESPLRLKPALPRRSFPARAVPLCASASIDLADQSCIWGSLKSGEGLAFWSFGQTEDSSTVIPFADVNSRPWLSFVGASVSCADAALLRQSTIEDATEWCLILVGWDGESLPVAVLPLIHGKAKPPVGASLVATLDVPLPHLGSSQQLCENCTTSQTDSCNAKGCSTSTSPSAAVSMDLQAQSGRLWVVLNAQHVYAWNLLQLKRLGHWIPRYRVTNQSSEAQTAEPKGVGSVIAVCEDSKSDNLLLAVQTIDASQAQDSRLALLKTPLSLISIEV